VRIALYHNLPQGGAMRFVEETVKRSSPTHHYDMYGAPGEEHDAGALGTARDVVESWRADAGIAARIDAGNYDLCVVHPSRLTHAPWLLTHLRTASIYYAHEPRRIGVEAPMRQTIFNSLPPFSRATLYAGDKVLQALDYRAVAAAGAVACNSVFTAEALYRIYGRTATVVRPGVDQDVFAPTATDRDDYVLSVGGLTPSKGHAMVIEALGLVPRSLRPPLQIAYGRGPLHAGFARNGLRYDEILRRLADRHDVTLRLNAGVTDEELADLYSRARATVCAARLEPFGLTVLESLSCGTPVVAVSEGGFRETVSHMRNGLLVKPCVEGIAGGVQAIIKGEIPADRESLRASMAARTWDNTVEKLHRLYSAIAGV